MFAKAAIRFFADRSRGNVRRRRQQSEPNLLIDRRGARNASHLAPDSLLL
jgi:hypothetical protein